MKKYLILLTLLIKTKSYALIPIIPILFWGIIAGTVTSSGLAIYCASNG